jgi:hypothetical protein
LNLIRIMPAEEKRVSHKSAARNNPIFLVLVLFLIDSGNEEIF